MRVCVFGAGAVGGYLAAMLLRAGRHEVAVVARGAQRTAIAAQGLTLCIEGASFTVRPHAVVEQAAALAPQDLVFVTTKAHAREPNPPCHRKCSPKRLCLSAARADYPSHHAAG